MGFFAHLFGLQSTGDFSEENTYKVLTKSGLGKVLRNLYIPYRGGFSEIDLVMINSKKIFVIENKGYDGWIFGSENQTYWTNCIKGGKKYKFYNPIKQNQTHINALSKYLKLNKDSFTSIIVFGSNSTLKKVPPSTEDYKIINRISLIKNCNMIVNSSNDIFSYENIENIYNKLKTNTEVSEETKKIHIENIQRKHSKIP